MNWILFIFTRGFKKYLVPADSEEDAYIKLAKRQSMSVDRCKREYTFVNSMYSNSKIVKI